jgi:exodeoxyribonuclease-3
MIFITWNVNSIAARLPHVEDLLNRYDPDLLCMQETKTVDEKFPYEVFDERGYEVAVFGEKTYNGVAIASKKPVSSIVKGFVKEVGPGSRRLIAASVDEFNIKVLNVYIPNGSAVGSDKYNYKLEWMQALKNHIESNYKKSDRLIICGDFNIAPEDRDIYNADEVGPTIMCSPEERNLLSSIKDFGFVDVFRLHHQETGLYSWWDYRMGAFRRNMGFRIDHIWTTVPLSDNCKAILIDREIRKLERPSDHAPVVADFDP